MVLGTDTDIFSDQSDMGAFRQTALRMTDQPLVLCCQKLVLSAFMTLFQRKVSVLWKYDGHLEFAVSHAARCVVKGGCVNLYCGSLRKQEGLYKRSIIGKVLGDILLRTY